MLIEVEVVSEHVITCFSTNDRIFAHLERYLMSFVVKSWKINRQDDRFFSVMFGFFRNFSKIWHFGWTLELVANFSHIRWCLEFFDFLPNYYEDYSNIGHHRLFSEFSKCWRIWVIFLMILDLGPAIYQCCRMIGHFRLYSSFFECLGKISKGFSDYWSFLGFFSIFEDYSRIGHSSSFL